MDRPPITAAPFFLRCPTCRGAQRTTVDLTDPHVHEAARGDLARGRLGAPGHSQAVALCVAGQPPGGVGENSADTVVAVAVDDRGPLGVADDFALVDAQPDVRGPDRERTVVCRQITPALPDGGVTPRAWRSSAIPRRVSPDSSRPTISRTTLAVSGCLYVAEADGPPGVVEEPLAAPPVGDRPVRSTLLGTLQRGASDAF